MFDLFLNSDRDNFLWALIGSKLRSVTLCPALDSGANWADCTPNCTNSTETPRRSSTGWWIGGQLLKLQLMPTGLGILVEHPKQLEHWDPLRLHSRSGFSRGSTRGRCGITTLPGHTIATRNQ